MKNKLNIGGIAFLLFLFSSHAWAQTYTTNIDGVILKNVECFYRRHINAKRFKQN